MSYTDIRALATKIKENYPHSLVTVDWSKSRCFLDVIANNKFYVFEERPLVNWYATSQGMDKTYGEEPDQVFSDREAAEKCFLELLKNGK